MPISPGPLFIASPLNSNPKSFNASSPISVIPDCKTLHDIKQIHAKIVKAGLHHYDVPMSKLIELCVLSTPTHLPYAHQLLDALPEPNNFMRNTIIRGYSRSSTPILGVQFYVCTLLSGWEPNSHTFPFLLKACALAVAYQEGEQIHAQVLKLGLASDAFIHTSLISMYARTHRISDARQVFDASFHRDAVSFTALINGYILSGRLDGARKLFDEIRVKDVVSWNAMISGYAQSGQFEEALALFQKMLKQNAKPDESTMVSILSACAQSGSLEMGRWVASYMRDLGFEPNLKISNALIDMYAKCGDLGTARQLFDELRRRDQISWNVMIGGYTNSCSYMESLCLFREMQLSSEEPNVVTFLIVLPACAHLSALDVGKWIHAYIDKNMKDFANPSLFTSLIDMYCKCGSLGSAEQVFHAVETKTLSLWNAMISGLAMHGLAEKAFMFFERMAEEGLQPDDITFVGILSACRHAGLVQTGYKYFYSIARDHKIDPKLEHYGCMIDLLGRGGLFDEAKALIERMGMRPDGQIWSSLLGACQIHGNTEFAEYIISNLGEIEGANQGIYVLLSNIYAKAGRWNDVARIRTILNEKGIKKIPGCSSIEVDSIVHEFLVDDRRHPHHKEIYSMLKEIDHKLGLAGHVPDTSLVLYDVEEEWKHDAFCYHSEKLAIAFGLISTKPRTTIRVVKNLRVCESCHSATKLISKIYNREIIARDCSRFHHFKDGVCSCNDFW